MAVYDPRTDRFYRFLCTIQNIAFIRMALYAFVAGATLHVFRLTTISRSLFLMIPICIIAKIFPSLASVFEHPLSKIMAASLFVGIEGSIMVFALAPLSTMANPVSVVIAAMYIVIEIISSLAWIISGIMFLGRVFVAISHISI